MSIPDEVFKAAERLARRLKRSRSEVYSRALAEHVARHAPHRVTEAMDRVPAKINGHPDGFVRMAARRILDCREW